MNNKKGYVTIYACMFFVSIAAMTGLLTGSAKAGAVQSGVEALGRVWGQSILAEYDLNLQQRYHLFGYYGSTAMVKEKLDFYLEESKPYLPTQDIETGNCSLYDHSLRNVEVFQKQVVENGKLVAAGTQNPPEADILPTTHHVKDAADNLFDDLPSEDAGSGLDMDAITDALGDESDVRDLIASSGARLFQNAYYFAHFKHRGSQVPVGESYLQQEIEYIICGKTSDDANEKIIKRRIIALREVMNLAYLNKNEAARNGAMAAAEILTPGPMAVATQQTLLGLWAYAESVNDYRLLIEGYPVPMRKNEAAWAVDLDSILANVDFDADAGADAGVDTDADFDAEAEVDLPETCIYTGYAEGDTYEDYLRLFLASMSGKIKLLRAMDLIQINMRAFYYDGFLLEDYYAGLSFDLHVDGEVQSFEQTY